jgi:hypothetical protein
MFTQAFTAVIQNVSTTPETPRRTIVSKSVSGGMRSQPY